jgi:hypothetical protein
MKKSAEFEAFDKTMRTVMSVPHDEIEKELDAEKAVRMRKKRKTKEGGWHILDFPSVHYDSGCPSFAQQNQFAFHLLGKQSILKGVS